MGLDIWSPLPRHWNVGDGVGGDRQMAARGRSLNLDKSCPLHSLMGILRPLRYCQSQREYIDGMEYNSKLFMQEMQPPMSSSLEASSISPFILSGVVSCPRTSLCTFAVLISCTGDFVSCGSEISKRGLFTRRPERCLPLKVDLRHHRLQWCREHKNWTTDQWSRVLFTDESRFSTRSDSQRVLIWREIGTRLYTSNIKERHHYGGSGVLVWGGIMLNGRTELHIFDRGSVIGDRYCEEVLLPHVRLFRGAIGPDFIFMDDNARPHRTLAVEELLESEDITRMDLPAYSPDLNPIEHVWDALGRRTAARLHHPENTQQLK
ncbi:transposable element Tcb2 transposase [Trichonephila clavipes]|nr:transposable element Tcb2 transposase [Trichonephila clavipes]